MERGGSGRLRVLLVENDCTEAETFARVLRTRRFDSVWARSGHDAIRAARQARFDLALIDFELPDIPGRDLVHALRADQNPHVILTSDAVTASVTRDAMQLRAFGVLGKPLTETNLTVALNFALQLRSPYNGDRDASLDRPTAVPAPWSGSGIPRNAPGCVAERWALFVLRTADAESDTKTLGEWAKAIGVSRSVLCECCRLVHVSPHDARDLARLMRAITRCGSSWQPETVLDLADVRTLKKLLAKAGLSGTVVRTPTIGEFLERQQWVPLDNPGMVALRELLARG
jgi:DNA-binding response OmpR family regulator